LNDPVIARAEFAVNLFANIRQVFGQQQLITYFTGGTPGDTAVQAFKVQKFKDRFGGRLARFGNSRNVKMSARRRCRILTVVVSVLFGSSVKSRVTKRA